MDKVWPKEIKYAQSFSNIKLSFLRRAKHAYNFSQWLKENVTDIVICIDVISCLYAKARKKSGKQFTIFSWPHFSLSSTIKNMQNVYNVRGLSSAIAVLKNR